VSYETRGNGLCALQAGPSRIGAWLATLIALGGLLAVRRRKR
jgi:MYXO-CTERM domain-containing protein